MPLVAVDLANKLHDALSQKKDGNGKPTPVSDMTLDRAKGVIAALKAAVVSNPPGTIVGVTAPGAPLSAGAGTAGVMVITVAPMLAITGVSAPPAAKPKLSIENNALITYIGTALVVFSAGGIVGSCTNTPTSPGPLAAGAGTGGKLTGITGAGAMAAVASATGLSGPEMKKHYDTLINYILQNAAVIYPTGGVVGVCPPGGGPLTAGAGAGGTIS